MRRQHPSICCHGNVEATQNKDLLPLGFGYTLGLYLEPYLYLCTDSDPPTPAHLARVGYVLSILYWLGLAYFQLCT